MKENFEEIKNLQHKKVTLYIAKILSQMQSPEWKKSDNFAYNLNILIIYFYFTKCLSNFTILVQELFYKKDILFCKKKCWLMRYLLEMRKCGGCEENFKFYFSSKKFWRQISSIVSKSMWIHTIEREKKIEVYIT